MLDRSDHPIPRHGGGCNVQRPGFRMHEYRDHQSVDGGMSCITVALACVKIDVLLLDAEWNLTEGSSDILKHALHDRPQDYLE